MSDAVGHPPPGKRASSGFYRWTKPNQRGRPSFLLVPDTRISQDIRKRRYLTRHLNVLT